MLSRNPISHPITLVSVRYQTPRPEIPSPGKPEDSNATTSLRSFRDGLLYPEHALNRALHISAVIPGFQPQAYQPRHAFFSKPHSLHTARNPKSLNLFPVMVVPRQPIALSAQPADAASSPYGVG